MPSYTKYLNYYLEEDSLSFFKRAKKDLKKEIDVFRLLENSEEFSDDLKDFFMQSFKKHSKAGWIYLATNPVNKNIFKIGFTSKTVTKREKSLNKENLFGELIIIESWYVPDVHLYESQVHKDLKSFKVLKEFFKFDSYIQASKLIKDSIRCLDKKLEPL